MNQPYRQNYVETSQCFTDKRQFLLFNCRKNRECAGIQNGVFRVALSLWLTAIIKIISSHIVVSSENATWYFPGNVHLLKCFPIKVPALIHLIAQIKISKFCLP